MRLLVSVTSADEARAALRGGADVIDVKDPAAGPLGAAAGDVVAAVIEAVGGAVPVSVALGDLPGVAAPAAATFVKAGCRGAGVDATVAALRAIDHPRVIAAAYADAAALDPPALPPSALPEVVARAGIAGALVDTYVKDGRGLYTWIEPGDLEALVARTPGTFAVAGQLGLGELGRVTADLVGVRSAVCRGDRTGALDEDLVAAARAQLGRRTVTPTPVRRTASGR